MIRLMEKTEEEIHGRKFHISDLTLTCLEFMQRRKQTAEWVPLGLDEPERPLGNKSNWDLEAQYFVEDLMTSAFRHTPALFALPHAHFLNVSIYGVSTSQIVKLSPSFAVLYAFERDMLNRNFKTKTPNMGSFKVEPAYAWDWKDYIAKREEFDTRRGKLLEEKVASLHLDAKELTKEQVFQMVTADKNIYRDQTQRGRITSTIIEQKIPGVSFQSARYAANKINRLESELLKAEADKLGDSRSSG